MMEDATPKPPQTIADLHRIILDMFEELEARVHRLEQAEQRRRRGLPEP